MPYVVYMLASGRHGTLYVGVTRDLARRVYEHKIGATPCFTSRYGITRLVWYETYDRIVDAIAQEKALKKWRRDWKIRLIEEFNPDWSDLYRRLPAGRGPEFIKPVIPGLAAGESPESRDGDQANPAASHGGLASASACLAEALDSGLRCAAPE